MSQIWLWIKKRSWAAASQAPPVRCSLLPACRCSESIYRLNPHPNAVFGSDSTPYAWMNVLECQKSAAWRGIYSAALGNLPSLGTHLHPLHSCGVQGGLQSPMWRFKIRFSNAVCAVTWIQRCSAPVRLQCCDMEMVVWGIQTHLCGWVRFINKA